MNDNAGGTHPGTPVASPIGGPGAPTPVAGFVGNALSFSFSRHVRVADALDLNFSTNKNFSIDAWVRTGPNPIVSKLKPPPVSGGYRLYVNGNAKLTLELGTGGSATVNIVGPTLSSSTAWYFIAVAVKRVPTPASVTFYVKAAGTPGCPSPFVVMNQPPSTATATSTVTLDIGKAPGGSPSANRIDELEIFDRVLSTTDVCQIYQAGQKGKCWGNLNPN